MTDQPATAVNRRRRFRLPCAARVKAECRPTPGGSDLATCALDVSEGGVRLILRAALAVGAEVEVGLAVDAFPGAVRRKARVSWCFPLATGDAWVGVAFDRPLPFAVVQALSRPAGLRE